MGNEKQICRLFFLFFIFFHKHRKAEGIVFEPVFDQTPVASQCAGEELLRGLKVGHIPTKDVGSSSATAYNLHVSLLSSGREMILFAVPNRLHFLKMMFLFLIHLLMLIG